MTKYLIDIDNKVRGRIKKRKEIEQKIEENPKLFLEYIFEEPEYLCGVCE